MTIHTRYLFPICCTLLYGFSAQGGCTVNYSFAMVDSAGQSIEALENNLGENTVDTILVPDGQFFRAKVTFGSCFGNHVELRRDGVLVEEWEGTSSIWIADQPGLYEWYVEAYSNMPPPPMTRRYWIVTGSPTSIGPELGSMGLIVRSLSFNGSSGQANLACFVHCSTDLRVEVLSLEGRLCHSSEHPLMQGENRLRFDIPALARSVVIVRMTTGSGSVRTLRLFT